MAMRNDTTSLLKLRAAHADVLHTDLCTSHLIALNATVIGDGHSSSSGGAAPPYAPYARYLSGKKAVVVAANPNTTSPLHLRLAIGVATLQAMGLDTLPCLSVEDVYQREPRRVVAARALEGLAVTIAPDKMPRGGLAVVILESAPCPEQ